MKPFIDRAAAEEHFSRTPDDRVHALCCGAGEHAFAAGLHLGLSLSGELTVYTLPDGYSDCCSVPVHSKA